MRFFVLSFHTEDFNMHHYVRFSQIGSHMCMLVCFTHNRLSKQEEKQIFILADVPADTLEVCNVHIETLYL